MVTEAKTKPKAGVSSASATTTATGGTGFRGKLEHVLYSGDKKHVFGGLLVVSAIFAVPWYFMTSRKGTKHQSHQDYLEKADKARRDRLSSSPK